MKLLLLLQGTCVASEKKTVCPRTSWEPWRGGAASSPPTSVWLQRPRRLGRGVRSCEQLPQIQRGAGGKRGVRKLDRKTDPDRSGRWNRRTATRPNDKGADYPNCFPYFPSFLSLFYAQGSFSFCKAGRCPDPHLAFPSGPPCGSHLWLLWWCTRCSLTPTHLPPPPLTKDLQPRGSGRASWRGRWFSWMSTPAARSESSTTTSCLCSWTPRSSKMVGSTF